jgi:hypothetical protein
MTDEAPLLPETRTDKKGLIEDTNRLPNISGEQYQHAGRFAGALVLSCFEQIGGLPRMAQWADTNPTDFYTKLFPKMITRAQQVDVSAAVSLDDALDRLDREAQIIDVTPTEVFDL